MALSMLVSLVIPCTPPGPSILAEGPGHVLQPMAKTSDSRSRGCLGLGYAGAYLMPCELLLVREEWQGSKILSLLTLVNLVDHVVEYACYP